MDARVNIGLPLPPLRAARAAQLGWLCFAGLALSLALAGLAPYARLAATVCEHEPCLSAQFGGADLAALGIAGIALTPDYARLLTAIALFPAAFALLVAGLGIWRRPGDPAVVLLAFVLAAFGAGEFAAALAREVPPLRIPATGLRVAHLAGLAPCLWLLPDGRARPRRLGPAALAIGLLGAGVALGIGGTPLAVAFAVAAVALGVAGLATRHRALPPGPGRERVAWALAGLALLAGAQLLGRPLRPLPLPQVGLDALPLSAVALVPHSGMVLLVGGLACLAGAALRDELFEADLALNRALVYALLTMCVVGGYALLVGYLSLVFQQRGNLWLSLVATGVVAALFQPLRERVQRLVNRLLYGVRDDPYAVVARLGRRLEAASAPEAVLPTVVRAVVDDLKLPYAAIALRRPDGGIETRATAGAAAAGAVGFPLQHQGEPVGELVVTPRDGEVALGSADRRLLEDLARHAGVAAHAVRLTDDLRRAREALVAAREEERRRLRRDLHDGLGPALATIAMQGDTARGLVRADPAEAEALLGELTAQAQATIGEVRRLIHALRPPVLDDLGLVAALRALATSFGTAGPAIAVEAPDRLPPLPAAVEVAAYRITQEALTNAVRHAGARRCVVGLRCDGALHLRVADDGRGIPAGRAAGVGLASLRERAEELGGTCRVASGASGGTVVCAALPLGGCDGADPPADR